MPAWTSSAPARKIVVACIGTVRLRDASLVNPKMDTGAIEIVASVLVTIGLFTRAAAFIASGEMAVAYFTAHFPKSFFPLVNGGDAAVLYCFIFLFLALEGGGVWSIDAARSRG